MKRIIITLIIGLILLSACEYRNIDNAVYGEALNICHNKNVDQAKYCQCYASCETEENRNLDFLPEGNDCHSLCREDWK